MPTKANTLRVLIVDDNQDGADALGLLVEELGNQVHVTYGGAKALEVATAFRPDLMLVDLIMPEMDGRNLVMRLRQIPAFFRTRIVAITGHADEENKSAAIKAGCDTVLFKPVTLAAIKSVLESVGAPGTGQVPKRSRESAGNGTERRLPIEDARRIRNERKSKALTQAESEDAICDGIIRFQEEYLGWRSDHVCAHLIKELLVVRMTGVLTLAERQLGKSSSLETGRELIKRVRRQLLEVARPMLESLVHEVTGVKVMSMHHDISTVTGEEVIVFSLVGPPPRLAP
jgi:CheY-like chemotaxis protein